MLLQDLKSQWNAILDDIEATDRIAWIAFFDGRLHSLESNQLLLDFSDSEKFADGHDYRDVRIRKRVVLEAAIFRITHEQITILPSYTNEGLSQSSTPHCLIFTSCCWCYLQLDPQVGQLLEMQVHLHRQRHLLSQGWP